MRSRMVAFLSGIVVFWLTPEISMNTFYLFLSALISILIISWFFIKQLNGSSLQIKSLLLLFIIGFFVTFQQHKFLRSQITSLPEHTQTITLIGKITSTPRIFEDSISFEVAIEELNGIQYGTLWRPSVRLSWYYPKQKPPNQGELWQFSVRLKPVHGYRNPQGFDYERWAFSKRIIAKGYVHNKSPSSLLAQNTSWLQSWRSTIQSLASDDSIGNNALIKSLLIGDKTQLDEPLRLTFQQAGLAHLLAISGLHVGMVALMAYIFFGWLWRRSNWLCTRIPAKDSALIFSLIIAGSYALLSGWAVPAQRALLMLLVFSCNQLFRLQWSLFNTLLFALVVLCLFNPVTIIDSSSWLSFGAVFLIASLLRFEQQHSDRLSAIFSWLRLSFMIWLGMLPITLILFGQIPLLGFVSNMLAIPLMSFFIMPLLLLGAFVILLNEQIAVLLWRLADFGLDGVVFISEQMSFARWQGDFPIEHGALLAVLVLLWLIPRALITQIPRVVLTLLMTGLFLSKTLFPATQKGASLLVFDVGQGLSALWEQSSPDGGYRRILFDTGYGNKNYQVARQTWLPYFSDKGIHHLDALVVSHNDADHSGGVSLFEKELSASTIYSGQPLKGGLTSTSCHTKIDKTIGESRITSLLTVSVDDVARHKNNNTSCVILIKYFNAKILLPGDIESFIEKRLVKSEQLSSVDVVIAPHHGSKTSSSANFVSNIHPKEVIFSTGFLNRFKFPRKDIVDRYTAQGSGMHNTAVDGAIRCRWNPIGTFMGCQGERSSDWGKWHWYGE